MEKKRPDSIDWEKHLGEWVSEDCFGTPTHAEGINRHVKALPEEVFTYFLRALEQGFPPEPLMLHIADQLDATARFIRKRMEHWGKGEWRDASILWH